MSDSTAKDLIAIGDGLFTKKAPILSLWQAITEQFYPENADYTYQRSIGMEFASHLMTGVPAMANRDLANAISATLRPPGEVWFHPRTTIERLNKDITCLRWLDYTGDVTRRAFYSPRSGFDRATKEGDRGFVSIGNVCIRTRPNRDFTGLSFRARHMRDVAWAENDDGFIDTIHVKDSIPARNLVKMFPKTASDRVKKLAEKDGGLTPVMVRHIVMPGDEYDDRTAKTEAGKQGIRRVGYALKHCSIIIDTDHQTVLEEVGQHQFGYVLPRWVTVPGFGYGYSPPSTINIADARMLQQITLTLLEAGQKAVDPPMQAVGNDVIQGGINLFAGGISWVDPEYDEKTGPAIKPLYGSNPNLGWGVDREKRIAEVIARGHFLDQIKFPDTSHARTAYETQKMWQEFIRTAMPLFDPIMSEYNAPLCDEAFTMLLRLNAFGPIKDIPKALRTQEIVYEFESPLVQAAQTANAQAFTSVGQLTSLGVQMDPAVVHDIDVDAAFRDALIGTGAPATWIVPKDQADADKAKSRAMMAQQQAQQQALGAVSQAADAAGKIGSAANMLQQGGMVPPQQPQQGGSM